VNDEGAGPLIDRVDALERRIAALEAPTPSAQPTVQRPEADGDTFWALHGLKSRAGEHSVVLFTGAVTRPDGSRYEWQQGADVDDLLAAGGWDTLAESLSALAHPARLNLLREVLGGRNTASTLAAVEGFGTSGQVYHHLRQLTSAGWLRSAGRGRYEIPTVRVIPLLTILAAASR